ncbi:MAG TPA: IS200/IS605 family transposase [Bacteroidia bacterium]|nr:IS200/IS605 family transposase [Bacteroidia bacterium]
MSHSYNKIWLHVIFSTKDRHPLIKTGIEKQLYQHLQEQLIGCDCFIRIINGMPDHVHLLYMQTPKMAVTDTLKQIKGNTGHWINEQNLIPDKFAWQAGYAAYSVSESQVERVYQYILNQKQHHKRKTFQQEYEEFILSHGLMKENG